MKTVINQIFATTIVNILALAHGFGLGWSSPAIAYLGGPSSPLLHHTTSDMSWIGSAVSIGALVGTIISGFISQAIGKKRTLMILSLPNLVFWVVTVFAKEPYEIIIVRFVAGLTGGGLFRVLGLYIADISENQYRGVLSSVFPLTMYTGMMLMFIFFAYEEYKVVSYIAIPFPALSFLLMIFLPETPYYWIEHKDFDKAFRSLKFYRSCTDKSSEEHKRKVEEELEMLKTAVLNSQETKLTRQDFASKKAKSGLLVAIFIVLLMAFSGNSILTMYTSLIFSKTGAPMEIKEAGIIIAAMQVIGILIMGTFVEKIGRKLLMIISCAGSAFALILIAIFMLFKESGTDTEDQSWMPLVILSLVIIFNSIGISSLPFVLISEMVPYKIREVCVLICMVISCIFMFITLKFFQDAMASVGLSACFWFFAVICIIGLLIAIFFLEETKGAAVIQEE